MEDVLILPRMGSLWLTSMKNRSSSALFMVSDHFIYAIRPVNSDWVIKLWLGFERDIRKYYNLIDHQILMNRRKDRKQRIRLIWKALRVGYKKITKKNWTFKNVWMRGEGTLQESNMSSLLANVYFHTLNYWVWDKE